MDARIELYESDPSLNHSVGPRQCPQFPQDALGSTVATPDRACGICRGDELACATQRLRQIQHASYDDPERKLVEQAQMRAKYMGMARTMYRPPTAQETADRVASKCATCDVIERTHPGDHAYNRAISARLINTFAGPVLFALIIAGLFGFFSSATTPGAPLHELTAPLMCFWDWKNQICP